MTSGRPLNIEPRLVAPTNCKIGENPLWHPELALILFLDIAAGRVYSYCPATGACSTFSQGPVTGGMALQHDGQVLLFQDKTISLMNKTGKQCIVRRNCCMENDRFNDVVCDPEGRVFAGALGGNGRLYRIDRDGTITEILDGIGVPNGMGFTSDLRHMYFTDSKSREIYLFDYKRSTGALSNRRVFAEIPVEQGVPDGMTVDADGYVWGAVWFGGRVRRYTPDGAVDFEVLFPATQTSAIVFGGSGYTDAYVTTASTSEADSMMPPNYDLSRPRGGGLYSFRIDGVKGTPLFRSRVHF